MKEITIDICDNREKSFDAEAKEIYKILLSNVSHITMSALREMFADKDFTDKLIDEIIQEEKQG